MVWKKDLRGEKGFNKVKRFFKRGEKKYSEIEGK